MKSGSGSGKKKLKGTLFCHSTSKPPKQASSRKMRRYRMTGSSFRKTVCTLLLTAFAATAIAPACFASVEGRRNTAIGLTAGAIYSLVKKKTTNAIVLGAGAAYAWKRHSDARKASAYKRGYRAGANRSYRRAYNNGYHKGYSKKYRKAYYKGYKHGYKNGKHNCVRVRRI
jgi:hypothetical protein